MDPSPVVTINAGKYPTVAAAESSGQKCSKNLFEARKPCLLEKAVKLPPMSKTTVKVRTAEARTHLIKNHRDAIEKCSSLAAQGFKDTVPRAPLVIKVVIPFDFYLQLLK